MLLRIACATLALVNVSATAPPPVVCDPPRAVKPMPNLAPNSTYVSDAEPPARFRGIPHRPLTIEYGAEAIARFCGRPPCRKRFLGCARGDRIAIIDPFTEDSQLFAKIMRHEMAHLNGWPATHGD